MPALPPPGQAVLIRVATTPARQAARQELRTVLRQVLAAWSGLSPGQLPLRETPCGPLWPGQLAGCSLDISLSYEKSEGWIGLLRGGLIGLDVMRIGPIAEAEEVARHYLGPVALAAIQQSPNPMRAFALAWTELEARLKCLKCELVEWSATRAATTAECASQNIVHANRVAVCVATAADGTQ
jgi:phosphopantetheinyl transferase